MDAIARSEAEQRAEGPLVHQAGWLTERPAEWLLEGATGSEMSNLRAQRSSTASSGDAARPRRKRRLKQIQRLTSALRRQKRDYMRRWRARGENRENERLRAYRWREKRALARQAQRQRLRAASENSRCAYCRREAVMKVERAKIVKGKFVPVQLPYCGEC
jgi:hypothetical protein